MFGNYASPSRGGQPNLVIYLRLLHMSKLGEGSGSLFSSIEFVHSASIRF